MTEDENDLTPEQWDHLQRIEVIEPIRRHVSEASDHHAHAAAALDELRAWELRYEACSDCGPMVTIIRKARAALELALRRAYVPTPGAPYAILYRSRRRYESRPSSPLWPELPPRIEDGPQWRRHFIDISARPAPSRDSPTGFAVPTVCRDWAPVPEDYLARLVTGQMVKLFRKDWARDKLRHPVLVDGDVFITSLWATPPSGVVETCLDCERRT